MENKKYQVKENEKGKEKERKERDSTCTKNKTSSILAQFFVKSIAGSTYARFFCNPALPKFEVRVLYLTKKLVKNCSILFSSHNT